MPAAARPLPRIGEPDARVAPEELLARDRVRQAGGIGERVDREVERVEPDLRGLLDDRPRRLFALVPLVGGRPDDVGGELVHPVLDLLLLLVELQGELGHGHLHGHATAVTADVTGR